MKLHKRLTTMLLLSSVSVASAGICRTGPGSLSCGVGDIRALTENGVVSLNGSTIIGATNINGVLIAEDANFSSMMINGAASLTRCTISTAASIKGTLFTSSTVFQSGLDIYSNRTRLIHTKIIGNLRIHQTDKKKQVVYLGYNSVVDGNITFEGQQGNVILKGGSVINGRVIGGEIINYRRT